MKYKSKLLVASAVLIGSLCFRKVLHTKLSSKVENILKEISTPIEHLTSSLQHKEPGQELAKTLMEESQAGNYVAITSSFIMNPLNRDSAYKISAYAKILENGIPSDIGDITIGSHIMSADSLNEYQFHFPLAEGKALHGDSIFVSLTEPNARTARTLGTKKIVVPKEFYPASLPLPSLSINRANSYTLNWQPDPKNQYGLVQIQLSYNSGLSQHYNTSQPSSIDDLVYRVADNGSYAIPSSDLSRFPKDGYVRISIARAWKLNSSGNIIYVAIAEAKTPPLLVVECPTNFSIRGPRSLCTTSDYSIFNLPVGATVQWSATPTGIVTINSPNSPQTSLTKSGDGLATLTATITNGNCSPVTKSFTLQAGVSQPLGITPPPNPLCADTRGSNGAARFDVINPISGYIYHWTLDGVDQGTGLYKAYPGYVIGVGGHTIAVRSFGCGSFSLPYELYFEVVLCGSYRVMAYPNPAKDNLAVQIERTGKATEKETDKVGISLYAINSAAPARQWQLPARQTVHNLNVTGLPPGTYTLVVQDGRETTSTTILIQK